MMTINFIVMGKLKERWFREACAEYQKRLGAQSQGCLLYTSDAADEQ